MSANEATSSERARLQAAQSARTSEDSEEYFRNLRMDINNEIARPGLSTNGSAQTAGRLAGAWHSRGQLGDQPSALARPGWLDLASTGSIWLPLAPLLARSGLDWLDLAAPGALAGSNWPSWASWQARFGCSGRSWAPCLAIESQNAWLFDCLPRCCLPRALWNVSSCLRSSSTVVLYFPAAFW